MERTADERPVLDAVGTEIKNTLSARFLASRTAASDALAGFDDLTPKEQTARLRTWMDGCLLRQHELPTKEGEVDMAGRAAETYLMMAAQPLTTRPDICDDYELVDEVEDPAAGEAWTSNLTDVTPDLWEQYIRVKKYRGSSGRATLREELWSFAEARPAHAPWVYVVLDLLSSLHTHTSVYLSYAGITVSSSPSGRIIDDLNAEAKSFFASFACHSAQARRNAGHNPARWQIWRLKLTVPCTSLQLRGRMDLQMAERIAISAIGLALNSAPGGFYHRPHYPELIPDESDLLDVAEAEPVPVGHIRQSVTSFLTYIRRVWTGIEQQGPRITDTAFEAAVENANALRLLPDTDHVLSVMIGKDIPVEDHQGTDPDLVGFYARKTGPGPALSLLYRCVALGCDMPALRRGAYWCALVGGFLDLWSITLVHLLIWLAILCLIGYFRRTRPLFIRVQSAKVSNIFFSGVLGSLIRNDAESLAYCQRFFERRNINIAALRACISPPWIGKHWVDLIPPDWVIWIGVIAVCPTGPGDRDWAIVIALGHDGRHKYDPYLAEELGRLSLIAQLRAARAELLILEHTATHPPPVIGLRDYLIELRSDIEADLDVLYGAEFDAAREDVKRKQEWLGRMRRPANGAEAAQIGVEIGLDDDLRARQSQGGTTARANDRARQVHAAGEPWSVERLEQFESIIETIDDLAVRGLGSLNLGPPRPARCTDENSYSQWWQSRANGCNMVRAAQRDNQAQAQAQAWTPEIGQAMWQAHFGAYYAAHPPPANSFTSTVNLLDAVLTAVRNATTDPNRRDRILHCILCNRSVITTYNGAHHCEHHDADLMPTSSTDMGVMTFRIDDADALLENPLVGLQVWRQERVAVLAAGHEGDVTEEQEAVWRALADADWEEELGKRNLRYLTPLQIRALLWTMNGLYRNLPGGPIFNLDMVEHIQPPLVERGGSIQAHFTQAGRAYIKAKSNRAEYHLPIGKDIESNDDALWASASVRSVRNIISRDRPVYEVVCGQGQPCDFKGLHYRTMAHACSSARGNATRAQTRKTNRFARRFEELPLEWQLRLWTSMRCEGGVESYEDLNWEVAVTAEQLQSREA